MNYSMYKGTRKFDREQLVFVVEAALCAAFDRIESCVPPCVPKQERLAYVNKIDADPNGLTAYERGALEGAGMSIAILYAQLSDDGIGIRDALAVANRFDEACEKFVKYCLKGEGRKLRPGDKCHPDARPYAEKYVDTIFGAYLAGLEATEFDQSGDPVIYVIVENVPVNEDGEYTVEEAVCVPLGFFYDARLAETKVHELHQKERERFSDEEWDDMTKDEQENIETRYGFVPLNVSNAQVATV